MKPFFRKRTNFGLGMITALLLVAAAIFFLHRKSPSRRLLLSFDGTLLSEGKQRPSADFPATYGGYLHRKALCLSKGQSLAYGINGSLSEGTVEFWLKLNAQGPQDPVQLLGLGGSSAGWGLFISGKGIFLSVKANSPGTFASTRDLRSFRQWQHLAVCWSNGKIRLYCNGREIEMEPSSSEKVVELRGDNESRELRIGLPANDAVKDDFTVLIRDLILWDKEGDRDEIMTAVRSAQENEKIISWRGCDLYHFAGRRVKDPTVAGGFAWSSDPIVAAMNAVNLPAEGDYDLIWRVRVENESWPDVLESVVWMNGPNGTKRFLAAEKLRPEKFHLGEYQDFPLRFHVPASASVGCEFRSYLPKKNLFTLDTVTFRAVDGNWRWQRPAEQADERAGNVLEDSKAEAGKAWVYGDALTYGPYTCIGQPGRYRATWRLKLASFVPPHAPVAFLNVFAHDGSINPSHRGSKIYGRLNLSSDDFVKRDTWMNYSIDFKYDGADMMEFRTFARTASPGALVVDTIVAERNMP